MYEKLDSCKRPLDWAPVTEVELLHALEKEFRDPFGVVQLMHSERLVVTCGMESYRVRPSSIRKDF